MKNENSSYKNNPERKKLMKIIDSKKRPNIPTSLLYELIV